MDPSVTVASVASASGLPSHHVLSNDVHFDIHRRPPEHQQQQQQIIKYEIWPTQGPDGTPSGWSGPVFQGMAPPTISAPSTGGMMHFSGYASFVPPSGFPPPNIAMAVALKSELPPPTRLDDPRIEYVRSVSQLSPEMNQDDSEEEGDKIQSKKGRGKGKKNKKDKDGMRGKKGKGLPPSPPEKRYKCPECSLMFPHVSALYNHASLRHYRQQLSDKYRKRFSENSQRCHLCDLPQTWSTFLQHIGSRHRRIHYFMSPEIHRAYMDLPVKRAHTKITGRIDCLVCTSKDFSSLTQYKQHLTTHFWKKMTDKFGNCNGKICPQCNKQFGHSSGVLMHLGAKHNYIMEFAPPNVQEQLQSLGVN